MSEIKFYGLNQKDPVKDNFAAKANKNKNTASLFKKPATRVLTYDNLKGIKDYGFCWPIIVEYEGNVLEIPSQKELDKIIAQVTPEQVIKVSLPIPMKPTNKNIIMFLTNDSFGQMNKINGEIAIVDRDFSGMFKKFGLDQDTAYVLIHAFGGGFYIIKELAKTEYSQSPVKDPKSWLEDFRLGYLYGWTKYQNTCYYFHKVSSVVDPKVAGMLYGSMIRSSIINHNSVASIADINFSNWIPLKLKMPEKEFSYLESLVCMHNEILSSKEDIELINKIKNLNVHMYNKNYMDKDRFEGISGELNIALSYLDAMPSVIPNKESFLLEPNWIKDNDFEIKSRVEFQFGQMRVVNQASDKVSLRFQFGYPKVIKTLILSGEQSKEFPWKGSAKEEYTVDINSCDFSSKADFKKFLEALGKLTYDKVSSAGTNMMYAPIIVRDNFLYTLENDIKLIGVNRVFSNSMDDINEADVEILKQKINKSNGASNV